LAKKPRTPNPPRNVQAPKQRPGAPRRAGAAGGGDMGLAHRNLLYGVAAAGIVGLIVVVLIIVLGGGSSKASAAGVATAMADAGCSFKTVKGYVPPGQSTHVASLTANDHWNTDPPSNGQHYPIWLVWDFYTDQPMNPRQVVHNEEHGGVILWWGSKVPGSTVEALRAFYQEQEDGVLGTPYPKLGSKIAITAWTGNPNEYQRNGYYGQGHIGICPAWSPKVKTAFTKFRDAYRGHGPEGIPLCDDQPGDGPDKSSC
jgi:hypothetical protein